MLLEERAKSGTLTPTPLPLCGRGTQAGYFFFAALRGAFLAGAFFAALRGVAFLAALRGAAFFVAFFTDAFFAVLRGAAFFAVFFAPAFFAGAFFTALRGARSEEHTSELQSLMRISYAVFCLKKKTKKK